MRTGFCLGRYTSDMYYNLAPGECSYTSWFQCDMCISLIKLCCNVMSWIFSSDFQQAWEISYTNNVI